MPTKNPQIYRWYYILQTESGINRGFRKNVYACINQKAPVLVHYVGDETLVEPFAHNLANDRTKHYKRTAPSILKELKNKVNVDDAHVVYKNDQTKFRNLKQCQNAKQYISRQKNLIWDEIYNSVLINLELNCVKREFTFKILYFKN